VTALTVSLTVAVVPDCEMIEFPIALAPVKTGIVLVVPPVVVTSVCASIGPQPSAPTHANIKTFLFFIEELLFADGGRAGEHAADELSVRRAAPVWKILRQLAFHT
jgi:hypothetical protein